MSQKPTASAPNPTRVSGGIPWWLWGILILVGVSIVASLISQSIPENPRVLFDQAMGGIKSLNKQVVEENLGKLRAFPDYANRCQLLEGLLDLAEGKPLKAIKKFDVLTNDKDKEVRVSALRNLGNAYAQADNRWKAIEIFESLVKEDDKNSEARFSLGLLYSQITAWDESLKHLNMLADTKFMPEQVLAQRADIYHELGELDKASADLGEAIKAKPTDPGNGTRAGKLMQILIESGASDRAEEFLEYVDQPVHRNMIEADQLIKKGELDRARAMAMEMRKESPLGLLPSLTLSKVMLAYGTKEKALEGLALLRFSLQGQRDVELYRNVAALARLAGDEPYAALVQQNVDQLESLNQQFREKLQQVVKTVDDPAPRIELLKLALQVGRNELAFRILDGLDVFYVDRSDEWTELRKELMAPLPQLVNTMSPSDMEKAAAAVIEARAAAGIPPGAPTSSGATPSEPAPAEEPPAPAGEATPPKQDEDAAKQPN